MPVGRRIKNGKTQWCASYVDSAGHRVQKFRATRELAMERFGDYTVPLLTRTIKGEAEARRTKAKEVWEKAEYT